MTNSEKSASLMNPALSKSNKLINKRKSGVNNSRSMQINGHAKEVDNLVKDILKFLHSLGVDKALSFDIRLCLEEAIVNAVKHGNKNNKNLPIEVSYSVSDDTKFKISVEDSGNGFDYKNLPDPTVKENLLNTSGRGVYLIKHLMDEVSFNKTGNKITMIKYLKKLQ